MKHLRLLLFGLLMWMPAPAETTLKDILYIEGVRDNQLLGYGLVVGLKGTGDRQQTLFSAQSLANVLQRMGVTVSASLITVKNTAAVMVTGSLPAFAEPGMKIDVTASSIGDAANLQGGLLIMTSLRAADGQVYAVAQGPVITGGFVAAAGAGAKTVNHPTVGRIPEGALVERPAPSIAPKKTIRLQLHQMDFGTASLVAAAINKKFPDEKEPTARAENGDGCSDDAGKHMADEAADAAGIAPRGRPRGLGRARFGVDLWWLRLLLASLQRVLGRVRGFGLRRPCLAGGRAA